MGMGIHAFGMHEHGHGCMCLGSSMILNHVHGCNGLQWHGSTLILPTSIPLFHPRYNLDIRHACGCIISNGLDWTNKVDCMLKRSASGKEANSKWLLEVSYL
jgi:hypothetical protein